MYLLFCNYFYLLFYNYFYLLFCNHFYLLFCNYFYLLFCNYFYLLFCNHFYLLFCNYFYLLFCKNFYLLFCNYLYFIYREMFIPRSFLIDLIHVLPKSDQFHPTGFIHNKVVFRCIVLVLYVFINRNDIDLSSISFALWQGNNILVILKIKSYTSKSLNRNCCWFVFIKSFPLYICQLLIHITANA